MSSDVLNGYRIVTTINFIGQDNYEEKLSLLSYHEQSYTEDLIKLVKFIPLFIEYKHIKVHSGIAYRNFYKELYSFDFNVELRNGEDITLEEILDKIDYVVSGCSDYDRSYEYHIDFEEIDILREAFKKHIINMLAVYKEIVARYLNVRNL